MVRAAGVACLPAEVAVAIRADPAGVRNGASIIVEGSLRGVPPKQVTVTLLILVRSQPTFPSATVVLGGRRQNAPLFRAAPKYSSVSEASCLDKLLQPPYRLRGSR